MADVQTGSKPKPATLLTGVETALGRSAALALARAGHRLCVLRSDGAEPAFPAAELPGHERLQHHSLSWNLADLASLPRLAAEARSRLGQITALVHVAPAPRVPAADELEPEQLVRQLQLGAGAFLSLGLALLPEMFATQTGALCVLTPSPAAAASAGAAPYASAEAGAAVQLGALLGAVAQLADRCAGTPLRSLLLHTGELGAGALSPSALTTLVAQLSDLEELPPARRTLETALLDNGWRGSLALPSLRSRIELLAAPAAPATAVPLVVAAAAAPVATASGAAPAAGPDRIGERLAQTFRSTFGLAASVDLAGCVVGRVPRWDSLGHLKLMMEVERALRVRLPAEQLAKIQSYRDLEQAVRAHLSAS